MMKRISLTQYLVEQQRELDDKTQEEGGRHDDKNEVNVAWGQALYNITSGRPAAVADAPASVRETDYLENIAQIQRAWDRELQSLRDELTSRARSIEEVSIVPSAKNIDVAKYVILWAAQLP